MTQQYEPPSFQNVNPGSTLSFSAPYPFVNHVPYAAAAAPFSAAYPFVNHVPYAPGTAPFSAPYPFVNHVPYAPSTAPFSAPYPFVNHVPYAPAAYAVERQVDPDAARKMQRDMLNHLAEVYKVYHEAALRAAQEIDEELAAKSKKTTKK